MPDIRIISVLGIGFVLGLKHAFDADHLIAVSSLVSQRVGYIKSSFVGLLWGVGHTAALLIAGVLLIVFNLDVIGWIHNLFLKIASAIR